MKYTLHACKEVEADTTDTDTEVLIPDGTKIAVLKFVGNSPVADNTHIELRFGGTPEWVVWAEGHLVVPIERTGNGVKKLTIALVNKTAAAVVMSGACEYEVYQ